MKKVKMNKISSTDLLDLYEGKDYTGRYHDSAGERVTRILQLLSLSGKDRVLDIGCGNGLLLPEIADSIGHYDGVDFSKAFIKDAKRRAAMCKIPSSKYEYHHGDIVKFCSNHKGYDEVFALDFTEHINDDELVKIFTSVKKSMKRGGVLVVHTPNKDYLLERLKPEVQKIQRQGHIGLRNTEEYQHIFKKIGFKKVNVIPLNHYVWVLKPLHLLSKFPNQFVKNLFQARLAVICEA